MKAKKLVSTSNSVGMKYSAIIVLQKFGPLFLILFYSFFVFLIKPRFLSIENLSNVSQQIVAVGLIALGQTFVLISGGIDLSTGSIIALSSITMGIVFGLTNNIWLAISAAIAIGLGIGAINSYLIAKIKLSPMIVTLATMSISMGLVMVITSTVKYVFFIAHPFLYLFGGKKIFNIPYSFILLVFIFFLGYIFYNYTRIGLYTRSFGNNEAGTRLTGINIDRYKIKIYMLSSFLAGLGGVIITCRMAIVQPILGASTTMLLDSVAAVVIGGTSLSGGIGTIQGTFVGLILIGLISNSLNVLNVNLNLQEIVRGMVLIFILFVNSIVNEKVYKGFSKI